MVLENGFKLEEYKIFQDQRDMAILAVQ